MAQFLKPYVKIIKIFKQLSFLVTLISQKLSFALKKRFFVGKTLLITEAQV